MILHNRNIINKFSRTQPFEGHYIKLMKFTGIFGGNKYRSATEISALMLRIIAEHGYRIPESELSKYNVRRTLHKQRFKGVTPTLLMYGSYLSYEQIKLFLQSLIEKELIASVPDSKHKEFLITSKGLRFLEHIDLAYKQIGFDHFGLDVKNHIVFINIDEGHNNELCELVTPVEGMPLTIDGGDTEIDKSKLDPTKEYVITTNDPTAGGKTTIRERDYDPATGKQETTTTTTTTV